MAENNRPNRSSNMEKAEGDRDAELVNPQAEDDAAEGAAHPGITNRSDAEESRNQRRVPPRGEEK